MDNQSAEEIARLAFDVGLITDRQIQEIWGQFGSRDVSTDDFTQALLRRDLLTSYQLARLKRDERTGFFYGDYKVLYLIGSGTFARVYRVEQKETGEIYALKVLRRRHASNAENTEQFLREGRVGISLRHPKVVPIYEVVSEGDSHYLVMEFVEGRSLQEFIKIRGLCEPDEAVRLMSDVTEGMAYALDQGVSHRDMKLSNVLVSSHGQAKLVDFGLAACEYSEDAVEQSANPRTIDYAGLERATGVRRGDPRSDIYFAGCMLYQLLTGKSPLSQARDRIKRLSKTRFEQATPIEESGVWVPRVVANVVNKATSLDVDRRYQTPHEMLSELVTARARLAEQEADRSSHEDDTIIEDERGGSPLPTVMVVESDPRIQDVLRERLKRTGYRVLVTADPGRALSRFSENDTPAHCVVFSTSELGRPALDAFNHFVTVENTRQLHAILLLGPKQAAWEKDAKLSEQHIVLQMPIPFRDFREKLQQLVPVETDELGLPKRHG